MKIEKDFKFYAGHRNHMLEGPCSSLHGHRYGLTVVVAVGRNNEAGVEVPFCEIDEAVNQHVIQHFDHALLVSRKDPDFDALTNLHDANSNPSKVMVMEGATSAENVAALIFELLHHNLPSKANLAEVRLKETDSSVVVYSLQDWLWEQGGKSL